MLDLSSADFWVVAGLGAVVGAFLGWLITSLVLRRANAGQSAAELRKEMDDYREEVNEHFSRTAELFKDTTEKYRDLYEHLAGGAQELCTDLPDRTRVEFRPGHLLAAVPAADEQDKVAAGPAESPPPNGTDAAEAAGATATERPAAARPASADA